VTCSQIWLKSSCGESPVRVAHEIEKQNSGDDERGAACLVQKGKKKKGKGKREKENIVMAGGVRLFVCRKMEKKKEKGKKKKS
jgi:hypothetical protein